MGKKRKAIGQVKARAPEYFDPSTSKLTINSYDDVADSEDDFLDNRDKVLLDEGRDAKKRRITQEDGLYLYTEGRGCANRL